MADNYLEKKFEAMEHPAPKVVRKDGPTLDSLLIRNRSTRGFSHGRIVTLEELRQIVAVNMHIASSKNQQALRFKPVTAGPEADFVNKNIKMGALFRIKRATVPASPDCPDLPVPGTEPQAFIVVYGTHPEDTGLLIDLGISLQSMSLKAMELGLNSLMIRAFNREAMLELAGKPDTSLFPVAVLAIGKSAERIFLVPTDGEASPSANPGGEPLDYFRKDGIHYVPKLALDKILI